MIDGLLNGLSELFLTEDQVISRTNDHDRVWIFEEYLVGSVGDTGGGILPHRFGQHAVIFLDRKLLFDERGVLFVRNDPDILRLADRQVAVVCRLQKAFSSAKDV